jgi:ribonuclease P protein component
MLCSADFEKALGLRPCAKSAHFFVHHVPLRALAKVPKWARASDLSTGAAPNEGAAVDDSPGTGPDGLPWVDLGMVVPKRHARRAVTRNLVKRHIRVAFGEQVRLAGLGAGGWVVRLRSPFEVSRFGSACSVALAEVVRAELVELLQRAATRSA